MSIRISQVPLCGHTKTDGLRCKSPAAATSAFCYYHRKLRNLRPIERRPRRVLTSRSLPELTDFGSIQQALSLVLNGIAMGRVDPQTATRMLKGLRIASDTLRFLSRNQ